MQIKDLISSGEVIADLRAPDKSSVLQELARRAAEALSLDSELVLNALVARERLGSTGIGEGAAIPHARLAQLDRPFGLFARLRQAVDFEAIDGRPVDLVFLLLLPARSQGGDLNALACVARRLRDRDVLAALRRAPDAAGLGQELMASAEAS